MAKVESLSYGDVVRLLGLSNDRLVPNAPTT